MDSKILCQLTNKPPDFALYCNNYEEQKGLKAKLLREDQLAPIANKAKKKTIFLCIIFGVLSILSIVIAFMTYREFNPVQVLKSLFRLIWDFALLYGLYIGNKKVKNIVTVLLALSIIIGFIGFVKLIAVSIYGLIMLPLLAFYSYMILYINFDKEYKVLVEVQSEFYE